MKDNPLCVGPAIDLDCRNVAAGAAASVDHVQTLHGDPGTERGWAILKSIFLTFGSDFLTEMKFGKLVKAPKSTHPWPILAHPAMTA